MNRSLVLGLLALTLSSQAIAADKKKPAEPDSAVDAFFDAPATPKKSSMDALQDAAKGVATTEKKGLQAKDAIINDEIVVKVYSAFAAEQIVMDKKLGCQPARGMTKLTFFIFDEVPSEGVPMSLCINLESKAGREVAMTISIVDPRNSRVVKAEDVVDFRNKSGRIDHVVDFPAPFFKLAGPYQYLVEMDGKEVARLPLFNVRVE